MTPQELKDSLFRMAFQGKLVERVPSDGLADEVIEENKKIRNDIIKSLNLKKVKPSPTIDENEVPFDIPETWKWARIQDFCVDVFSGKSPAYVKQETEYRIVGQAANQQEGLDESQVKYTNEAFWLSMSPRYFLKEYDVLLNTLGNGTLGRSGIISELKYPLLTDGHLFVFRLNGETQSKFFHYFLQFRKKEIEKSANGSTNQTFLSLSKALLWLVPVPPLAEQKRIVAKIEELLPYIDRYEKAWSRLEDFNKRFPVDMQKSILQMAIQGKLVPQLSEEGTGEELFQQIQAEKQALIKFGTIKKEKPLPEIVEDEIPFDIPETWKWTRLGEISHFQGGYAYKSTSYVPNSNNQIIRLGNVKQNHLLLEAKPAYIPDSIAEATESYLIKKDDLLVTMTGTRRKKDYLFVARIQESDLAEKKLFINQRVGCFRCFSGIDPAYLQLVLQEESIRSIIF